VTSPPALRVARYAEGRYAVIALVLAVGLPLPPRGQGVVLFAHWIGTAVLAAAIAFRLGRPNKQTWYVAAILAFYVLFNAAVAIVRMAGPGASALGQPTWQALGVGGVLWLTQAVVAVCLYQARELRTMPSRMRR
jgi:peptidoglycan/LPS O-acetylase OafA/YrhL